MTEKITSERYEGLIEQARKVSETHEESGWKLAELVFDAVEELRLLGLKIRDVKDPRVQTAARRVATDLGISPHYAYLLRRTWEKYGPQPKRMSGLNFQDHISAAHSRTSVTTLKGERARKTANKSRRPSERIPAPAVDPGRQYQYFSNAKSNLRKILTSDIWDYSDREKALANAQEIHQLAVEVLTKFGGQQQAEAPRRTRKAAA